MVVSGHRNHSQDHPLQDPTIAGERAVRYGVSFGEPAIKREPTPTGAVVVTGPAPVVETEIACRRGMLTHPWRHQQAAYRYVLDHFASGLHGILLAMGMGTGKSLVACMLVLGLAARRVLIACPLRVVPVWISQFERHVGTPVVIAALDEDAGSVAKKQELAEEKMRLAQARGVPFVAVINFDGAWRDPFAAWAEKQQWDIVIADEAHRIKSPGGKASLFFKRLRLRSRTASRCPAPPCRTARWTSTRCSGSWTSPSLGLRSRRSGKRTL